MLRKPREEPSLLELFRGAASNRRSQLRVICRRVFFILNTKTQRDYVFFGSGRYREQLKLLYKGHKVFCRKVFFWTQRHRDTEIFCGCGRYREQLKLLLQRTQSYLPQCKSPRGIRGAGGFLCRKALWRLLSRLFSLFPEKNFVPLCLCVITLTLNF